MPQGAHHFVFKCFLEGVEVPFLQASVQCRRQTPVAANVQFAPTSAIRNLLPNTLCHIFWFDEIDQDWKLFFGGVAVGQGKQKEPRSQSVDYNFESVSTFWYQAYLFYFIGGSTFKYANTAEIDATGATGANLGSNPNKGKLFNMKGSLKENHTSILEGKIIDTYSKVLSRVKNGNDFFAAIDQRLKLNDRVSTLDDEQVDDLVRSRAQFEKIFDTASMATHSSYSPIIDVLTTLSGFLYYDWVDIQPPVRSPLGTLKHLLFKPSNFFGVPPHCNVFYPSRYTLQSESRNFRTEPTRLIARVYPNRTGQGIAAKTPQRLYYAPPELQAVMDELRSSKTSSAEVEDKINNLNSFFLTAEELTKGVVPRIVNLSASEWALKTTNAAAKRSSTSQDSITAALDAAESSTGSFGGEVPGNEEYIRSLVQYKFSVARFEQRTISLSHAFNPYPVVGFPALILDSFTSTYGFLVSATHTLTPRGGNSSFTVGMTRRVGEPFGYPDIPPWINELYVTGDAYGAVLGSSPLFEGKYESDPDLYASEAESLFNSVRNSPDPGDAAYARSRRTFMTEEEFFEFLGASGGEPGEGAQVYSGGPFVQAAQDPVRAHVEILAANDALDGG
jgi:hypothetical protein